MPVSIEKEIQIKPRKLGVSIASKSLKFNGSHNKDGEAEIPKNAVNTIKSNEAIQTPEKPRKREEEKKSLMLT